MSCVKFPQTNSDDANHDVVRVIVGFSITHLVFNSIFMEQGSNFYDITMVIGRECVAGV